MENKNFNTGIYQIVNLVNGKRYIGSAKSLHYRQIQHFTALNRKDHYNKYLQNAYNKYGKENFKFEILLYCSKEDLIFYEQRAIDAYDFKILYNLSPTAGNSSGFKHSVESKIKIGNASRSRILTPQAILNISKAQIGRKHHPETIEKIRIANIGRKHLPETFIKMRKAKLGIKASDETKEKMSIMRKGKRLGKDNILSIPVYQINKETNKIIKAWSSAREVERILKINHSNISGCCKGKLNIAGDFKWAYVKDYENKKGE